MPITITIIQPIVIDTSGTFALLGAGPYVVAFVCSFSGWHLAADSAAGIAQIALSVLRGRVSLSGMQAGRSSWSEHGRVVQFPMALSAD